MMPAQAVVPQAAQHALASLLSRCLEEALITENYASWTLQIQTNPEENAAQEFTMLTISSYDFRMFVLLHSSCNTPSMRYAADALRMPPEQLTTARYYDFLGELGNRFCGAFKRDLGSCFPHMGMSTPNRLRGESLKHIQNLSFAYDTHINAHADTATKFNASLYASFYGEREFHLENLPQLAQPSGLGELELF